VDRSTLGTAGFNREIANVATINNTAPPAIIMIRRFRFFAATPALGTSMDERLGVNPAGRTIVLSTFASLFCMANKTKHPQMHERGGSLPARFEEPGQWWLR